MLMLADRGYTGFPLWLRAKKTGADLLWRARSQPHFPVKEAHEDGSWRSVFSGKGTDNTCEVRVIDYTLKQEDATVYRLVTTMLDPEEAPADELAALYHERWEIETTYDEVKTHMLGPGAMLRSKTPDLVQQEFEGLMLAYYAVRALITKAAKKADEDPDRLSFVHTVNVLQRRIQQPGVSPPLNKIQQVKIEQLIDEILEERVVSSRGQRKPRGRRQKMSKHAIRRRGYISREEHDWISKILTPVSLLQNL